MKELVIKLSEAAKVYYQGKDEIMSNLEYDTLYDELLSLEKETGVVLSGSVTRQVGYETLSELPKEEHVAPMLSLDKTKSIDDLSSFLSQYDGILSMKLDGLSIIVTYDDGHLSKALTRGNGEIGEVITNNAKVFKNLPSEIPFHGHLVIRGEALIKYSDFERMNKEFLETGEQYKNPRNLCSGSVRQLNNEITAKRNVNYIVYNLIETDYQSVFKTRKAQIEWLSSLGFDMVPYKEVNSASIYKAIEEFSEEVKKSDYPSDGLVLAFDDLAYSASLGRTAKFPRDSIAFKWKDELATTILRSVEWSASRTGLINPVAIFDPVELEGTSVSRASVHNISIVKSLKLGLLDEINVYKANMIIPQIYENITQSNTLEIPKICPVCGSETEIKKDNDSEVLFCNNPNCQAKKIKSFTHFVSRNALNIDGLSESTIEKIIALGILHQYSDFYKLAEHKDLLISMEGFGEKSYNNLIDAINQSKNTSMPRLLFGLGIKGVGLSVAKLIYQKYPYRLSQFSELTIEMLTEIDGIGNALAEQFYNYFNNTDNTDEIKRLEEIFNIEKIETSQNSKIQNKTFVITGSLTHFTNRTECKETIEQFGGKVTGSVSKNTDYLINNDTMSNSSKNIKAKELRIPILSEEELLELLNSK